MNASLLRGRLQVRILPGSPFSMCVVRVFGGQTIWMASLDTDNR